MGLNDTMGGADWYEFKVHIRLPQEGKLVGQPTKQPDPTGEGAKEAAAARRRPAPTSGQWIALQADYDARQIAARRLARELDSVNSAWQRASQAQAIKDRLWQEGTALQAEWEHWLAAVQEATERENYWWRTGTGGGDIRCFTPRQHYFLRKWRRILSDARRERYRAATAGTRKREQFNNAEAAYGRAESEYLRVLQNYEAEFAKIYREEYPKRTRQLEATRDTAKAESEGQRKARLQEAAIPGEYTWLESGRELGTIALHADHSFEALSGEKKPTYRWQVTEDGLLLTQEQTSWLFLLRKPTAPSRLQ